MAHSEVETLPEVLEQPDVYDRNAHRHEKAVAEILDTFHKAFRPFENEQQQYIDVGCGPGGFTKGYLLPRCLPCRRLVAVDKSAAMLRFAAEKYPHPKIDYLPLDISQDVDEFVDRQGQFQRVYSFLTLHWVRDQGRAIRNIENLMAAGGECILLFKTSSHFFHLFAAMMNSPRWEKYSQVLKNLVPESAYLSDVGTLRTYAKELVRYTNLTPLACEVFLPPQELHWNTKTMTESLLSFNPVYSLLNDEEREDLRKYIRDFAAPVCIDSFNQRPSNRMLIFIHAYKEHSAANTATCATAVKLN
ncbi:juvenile hormone acid O-methyltransferase-like isoform X1 [Amblyomma americanum]